MSEYTDEQEINNQMTSWVDYVSTNLIQIVSENEINSLLFKETELVGSTGDVVI